MQLFKLITIFNLTIHDNVLTIRDNVCIAFRQSINNLKYYCVHMRL